MEPEPKAIVGRNIKAAREAAGLTQEELADRAGMHTMEISRYERGVRDLRMSTVARLADGLEIPAAVLVDGLGATTKKAPGSGDGDEGPGEA